MTELVEAELHIRCETCNKKINLNNKMAFVFYNIHDPPVICHISCSKKNADKKSIAVRKSSWENRPERYNDLNTKQRDIAGERALLNMRYTAYTHRRRRTRRRRRW